MDVRTILSEVNSPNEIDKFSLKQMIIYSNNAESIIEVLPQSIKPILDGISEELLVDYNIQKIVFPNELFYTPNFDSYEIAIFDKKYLIKKFGWTDTPSLPTGLSTTYLNIHGKFTSVGYIAFGNLGDDSNGSLFLLVEEKMDYLFRTDNFNGFKDYENQFLWFIFDFLHILDRLISYKIKLSSQTLLFAVKKDGKRWRFRVDDIGYFKYVSNGSPFENYDFLINTFNLIHNTIKKKTIGNHVNRLISYAENLKNAEHLYYIEMLISEVEKILPNI